MGSNDSIDSPLSSVPSDEEAHHEARYDGADDARDDARSADGTISAPPSPTISTIQPPSKRPRFNTGASAYDFETPASVSADITMQAPPSPGGSISSDSSGEVPNSPSFAHLATTHPLSSAYAASQANPEDPDAGDTAQVTRCMWTDCPEPEQGNMDRLVEHIHSEHIGLRQKKYSCEWEGCTRKSYPHASNYALKAHMRSHTREKPFYCQLPECDRCFTRSDALMKHMRTVHETEALRPSDPVPKGHSEAGGRSGSAPGPNGSVKRIKLFLSNGERPKSVLSELPPLPTDGIPGPDGEGGPVDIDSVAFNLPVPREYYPSDIADEFTDHELSLPPSQLVRLLRRQVQWAEQESQELQQELKQLESATDFRDGDKVRIPGMSKLDRLRYRAWSGVEHLLQAIVNKEEELAARKRAGRMDVDDQPERGGNMSVKESDGVEVET